jgi:two-component system phosphate regulon sensor histidine kinase PhoR
LGLAIVKHVVNRHGGELKIASSLGKGSSFSCEFPVAVPPAVEARAVEETETSGQS